MSASAGTRLHICGYKLPAPLLLISKNPGSTTHSSDYHPCSWTQCLHVRSDCSLTAVCSFYFAHVRIDLFVPLQNIVFDANTHFISILLLTLAPTGSLHPNTASHSHRSMCVNHTSILSASWVIVISPVSSEYSSFIYWNSIPCSESYFFLFILARKDTVGSITGWPNKVAFKLHTIDCNHTKLNSGICMSIPVSIKPFKYRDPANQSCIELWLTPSVS